MPLRLSRSAPLLVAALAAAGCGLVEYEKKMQEVDAKLQRFDEENRVLGDALVLPPDPKPTVDVFLRPPKGVSKNVGNQPGDIPYHYPANGGVCSDLFLVFGAPDDAKDAVEKQIADLVGVNVLSWQPVEVQPDGRPPTAFDAVKFADPRAPGPVYIAYVHQTQGSAPVGVVFHVPQPGRNDVDDAVKKSLESYAEAGAAAAARADFARRGR